MKLKMYSIYDKQACFYYPPFFAKTDSEAMRMIHDVVVYGDESMLRNHPSDFTLNSIGSFDDNSGIFTSNEHPVLLLSNLVFKGVLEDAENL